MGEQWHNAFHPLFRQTHPHDYPPSASLGCLVPMAGTVEAPTAPRAGQYLQSSWEEPHGSRGSFCVCTGWVYHHWDHPGLPFAPNYLDWLMKSR